MKIGISPTGWTNDDLPEIGGHIPFEQCLSEMEIAGFEGREIGVNFPKNTNELRKHLLSRNLVVCNQWFNFELTTRSLKENLNNLKSQVLKLKALNCKIIGGGELGNSCHTNMTKPIFKCRPILKNKSEWERFMFRLNECGKMVSDYGMKLAFHHHMGTVIQSANDTRRMLDGTNPDFVHLNFDSAHYFIAGDDPVDVLSETFDRIAHVHLKNVRQHIFDMARDEDFSFIQAIKAGIFTVPGDKGGAIDFGSIFKILKDRGYSRWIVVEAEQDPSEADPLEYAILARSFIKKMTGK